MPWRRPEDYDASDYDASDHDASIYVPLAMTPWLSIIGLGEDGLAALSPAARSLLDDAEVLVGGKRHLAMLPEDSREQLTWTTPLSDLVQEILGRRGQKICILATGDPMAFGIGVTFARHLPAEDMVIIPAPSAFSLAAARLGWPLDQVETLTLHGRPLDLVNGVIQPGAKLLILSEDGSTPCRVAQRLIERGYGESRLTALCHMGGPEEDRFEAEASGFPERDFPALNTLAVDCRAAPGTPLHPPLPGLPDEAYRHDGQITKREIRAVTLAALAPLPGQRLWDIGAGAGSIAIEWLRAARGSQALAIESKAERRAFIAENAAVLGVPQLEIVAGRAPEVLQDLAAPDAVFVGGGASAPGVLETAWQALPPGGRLVANAVTLESEAALLAFQKSFGGQLTRLAVSRAEPVGPFTGWRPLMPVIQLAAIKT